MTSLSHRLMPHVFCLVPNHEMIWADATWVIAMVENVQPRWDLSVKINPCQTVRAGFLPCYPAEVAIATGICRSSPLPALSDNSNDCQK